MAVEFTCPACQGSLRVRDEAVGRVVRCGGCLTMLRVPEVEPTAPAEPTLHSRPARNPTTAPLPVPPPAREVAPPEQVAPPPRRSWKFWALVMSTVFATGLLGCCGLAAILVPAPKWRPHDSQQGGFKVELPAPPQPNMQKRLSVQAGRTVEGTALWIRGENYAIIFWDVPSTEQRGNRRPDARVLDETVGEVKNRADVRDMVRNELIEGQDFPTREFELLLTSGGHVTGRVIVADTRVYVLWGGGRFTRPGDDNIRRFLDTFAITDPLLLKEVTRRANLAEEGAQQLRQRVERQRLREAAAIATRTALNAVLPDREP